MAGAKPLQEVAEAYSTWGSLSSFTSAIQDEREHEAYLRGPTYDGIFSDDSRGRTRPVPPVGFTESADLSQVYWPGRSSSPPPRGIPMSQASWDRLGEPFIFKNGEEGSVESEKGDKIYPLIELPQDLGDLIPEFDCHDPEVRTVNPTQLTRKRKRGSKTGKLSARKARRLINSLQKKLAKQSAAASASTSPRDTYRMIDPEKLAEVEKYKPEEFLNDSGDEGGIACHDQDAQ